MRILLSILAFTILSGCTKSYQLTETKSVNISVSDTTTDPASNKIIAPYKQKLDAEMNQVIGYTEEAMEKNYPEGVLGNYVADLLLFQAFQLYKDSLNESNTFTLINNGGLRTSFPKGDITKGKVYELMPFENEMVVCKIKGELIPEVHKYLQAKKGQPVSGNVQVKLDDQTENNFLIQQQKINPEKYYYIITSDYLSAGGDNMEFFKESKVYFSNIKLRDLIFKHIEYTSSLRLPISSKLDGRVK